MTEGRLKKNTSFGKLVATVEHLGYVPPCVKEALGWLPYPFSFDRKKGYTWFWEQNGGEPPEPCEQDGERCHLCIFQEPNWSQNFAACSMSWLHDQDGQCGAYFRVQEFLEQRPDYADFCNPPGYGAEAVASGLLERPCRSNGVLYTSFGPSCNIPSHFYARLNLPDWYAVSQVRSMYQAVEQERLHRFWQMVSNKTIKDEGAYQVHMFLD